MTKMTFAQMVVTLFFIMDPFGNVPFFASLLKNFPAKERRRIIIREMLIALAVILFFSFIGNSLLEIIGITASTVQISGGMILFLIALQMIFPSESYSARYTKEEPFIVPLAIPLVAGPSMVGVVMVYAYEIPSRIETSFAILIAWIAAALILLASSLLQRLMGTRLLMAGERLMGLVLTILAVDMFNRGIVQLFA